LFTDATACRPATQAKWISKRRRKSTFGCQSGTFVAGDLKVERVSLDLILLPENAAAHPDSTKNESYFQHIFERTGEIPCEDTET